MSRLRTDVHGALAAYDFGAFAFDLDGTIYLGDKVLPGAVELIGELRARKIPYLFATNNSSKRGRDFADRLSDLGIDAEENQVLTSNHVAAAYLLHRGYSRVFIFGTDPVIREYEDRGLRHQRLEPEAVLLTYDTTATYSKIERVQELLLEGIPYFATHPDLVCPTPKGPLPDCGAFIELFLASSGRRPATLGKPSAPMAEAIKARLPISGRQQIGFVGDRIYTDMKMAREWDLVGVLTLTGEADVSSPTAPDDEPHVVINDLRDLLESIRAQSSPTTESK